MNSTNPRGRRDRAPGYAPPVFLYTSRRYDDTGETTWVRPDAIRTVALPWRCDARFNPDAADYRKRTLSGCT